MSEPSAALHPDNWWHTFVFVNFGGLECDRCGLQPDTGGAWEDLPDGVDPAIIATNRIVPRLISDGWTLPEQGTELLCPRCARPA